MVVLVGSGFLLNMFSIVLDMCLLLSVVSRLGRYMWLLCLMLMIVVLCGNWCKRLVLMRWWVLVVLGKR